MERLLGVEEHPVKDQNRREFESHDNAEHQITSSWLLQPERSLLGKSPGVNARCEKVESLTDLSFTADLDLADRIPSVIPMPSYTDWKRPLLIVLITFEPDHRPSDSRSGWVKVMGSLGRTPYFFCLARPNGHPPKVTAISTACKAWAILLPFLARVQIGHRSSQKSGSNISCLLNTDRISLD